MSTVSTSVLSATVTAGINRELDLIEFVIDGVPLRTTLIEKEEARGGLNPKSSLPHFRGLLRSVLIHYWDVSGTGSSGRERGERSNFAPVMACECGEPSCGGVWTEVTVDANHASWSEFACWDGGQSWFGPVYDERSCVFNRNEYESLMMELVGEPTPAKK